jgi:3-keto-5-aminohexanoate cleavage enzyme
MTTMEKLVITAALVGGVTTREQNSNLPYTPWEIAKAAVDSWKQGASVVHLHSRDPVTGQACQKPELFAETIRIVRNECDVIINTSTGAGPGISVEDRIAVVPALSADSKTKPEMASLNCGSLNFGILNRKKREFVLNDVQMNPWASLLNFADTMTRCGVKPELEIYDAAMINNAMVLHSIDALREPLYFQFVLGVLGGIQPTIDNLVFLKNSIPRDAAWCVCSVGLSIYTVGSVAIGAGGHVRVGLEDCVHIAPGVLAESRGETLGSGLEYLNLGLVDNWRL